MLAVVLGAFATFVVTGAVRTSRKRQARIDAQLARDTILTEQQIAQGVTRLAIAKGGLKQTSPPEELRRRVASLSSGTYLDDILAEQDSTLWRWPEHLRDALRVYIEPASTAPGWQARYPDVAREVFAEWSEAGFPLRFTFVYDSASADVSIGWRDRFPPTDGQRIGVTEREQTSSYEIARARVSVATRDSAGRVLSPTVVAGIIRHEVGHALGLNHANDSTSVMYQEAATSEISVSDRATLRAIYLMPGGSLKD